MNAAAIDPAGAQPRRISSECRAHTSGGELTWRHERQYDSDGRLSCEFATGFKLNSHDIDDRFGEHLLDTHTLRVDGSRRSS